MIINVKQALHILVVISYDTQIKLTNTDVYIYESTFDPDEFAFLVMNFTHINISIEGACLTLKITQG